MKAKIEANNKQSRTEEIIFKPIVTDTGKKYFICSKCETVVKNKPEMEKHVIEHGEALIKEMEVLLNEIDKDFKKRIKWVKIQYEIAVAFVAILTLTGYIMSFHTTRTLLNIPRNFGYELIINIGFGVLWLTFMQEHYFKRWSKYLNERRQKILQNRRGSQNPESIS